MAGPRAGDSPPAARAPAWTADRQRVASGAPWEGSVGYARAVRVGPFVYVAGTTGVGADGRPVPGGTYAQTHRAFAIAVEALGRAGAGAADVVRTRMYLTTAAEVAGATRAHAEWFGGVRPAATLVVVAALIDPELLVEVEVDAVVGGLALTTEAGDGA